MLTITNFVLLTLVTLFYSFSFELQRICFSKDFGIEANRQQKRTELGVTFVFFANLIMFYLAVYLLLFR